MTDLALLGFVTLLMLAGLRRPFIWVLAYIYIDIVIPQKIGWSIISAIPLSLLSFIAAFGGWLALDSKKGGRFTFRQGLLAILLLYCGITTLTAAFPESALTKWDWVWKALLFAMFLPLTLRTRLRIEAMVLIYVLSLAAIIIDGGIKTLAGGGGYGELKLLVVENAGIYESSIVSCAAIAMIPLALWLTRYGTIFKPDIRVKLFAAGLIFAALLMLVGTEARTGLLCIAVLGALMLRSVKHRFLYLGLAVAAVLMTIPFLPQSFTERMDTISSHEGDESASTRIAVWQWTIDYASQHPLGGGFNSYLANSFTYQTRTVTKVGDTTEVHYDTVTDEGRAFHSSYFEMLGEQGWPGLILWLWLHLLGIWQMERLRWRFGKREGGKESWQWGLATSLQQAQIVYLTGAAFVGIAYQPFAFMIVGMQCALWSYVRRVDREEIERARPHTQPWLRQNPQTTEPVTGSSVTGS
ncbi:putative O-glycosylation ligase, exosortase A system-associated [Altericroceibacterium spongiae]|uniref:Putative O-glycosylation ligase, exosortase A system-associated n=1 Tax=Altericroceibacterium spongiae TaxID=2320269 RepID=A0A420EPD9_9SPHN|nr:putative O-glycosylation ligase, exosortase A system-associated [Altericroceibacterium spongiae]RKF22543.1 putative O-glycosylation ligase, exosortase A system-associated [Altericroceibacterium spongiae]